MRWRLEPSDRGSPPAITFRPRDVLRLAQLSRGLPWLDALDPYRDRKVSGAELVSARRDLESVLVQHERDFVEEAARRKGTDAGRLRSQPHFLAAIERRLNEDPFHRLIEATIEMVLAAEHSGAAVWIAGS